MNSARHPSSRKNFLCAVGFILLTWSAMAVSVPVLPPPAPPPPLSGHAPNLTLLETLGQRMLFDRNLSEPAGTACANCHSENNGFSGNNGSRIGVPLGSTSGALGLRNSMTNAYGAFAPVFSFRVKDGDTDPIGGHFWDGRADTLAAQALGPFLASAEMNNPNAAAVVKKVSASGYANLFRAQFGQNIFSNPDLAFQNIGVAIAAFESSSERQPFSSKYDQFVRGKIRLAPNEARGMALFMDPNRANCASCHKMNPGSGRPEDSLLTDFAYYALGIPRNAATPSNANPGFFDLGLCGPKRTRPALGSNVPANVSIENFCGTFKMPTLRNVANRPAFMHNGFFKNLRDVVSFYSSRNSDPKRWYGSAGVPNDLPTAYLANIIKDKPPFNNPASAGPVLNPGEIDDVVSFLQTLSDGFVDRSPPPAGGRQ